MKMYKPRAYTAEFYTDKPSLEEIKANLRSLNKSALLPVMPALHPVLVYYRILRYYGGVEIFTISLPSMFRLGEGKESPVLNVSGGLFGGQKSRKRENQGIQ